MSDKGEKYINEVIKPLLPTAKLSTFLATGNNPDLKLTLFLPVLLDGSMFHQPFDQDLDFIHFTSISNLFNIIRSRSIWMKDLNSMDDEKEFVFANSYLDSSKSEKLKSRLLALSLCEFSENTVRNDFMWKEYGEDHKGVCIKLRLHKHQGIPPIFLLGKIKYHSEKKPIDELVKLKERHDSFKEKEGYGISNLDEILFAVSAMYKRKCYIDENEIRLIIDISDTTWPYNIPSLEYSYDKQNKAIRYFMEIPINNSDDTIIAPHLSIEDIILGKEIGEKESYLLRELINEKYRASFNNDVRIFKM